MDVRLSLTWADYVARVSARPEHAGRCWNLSSIYNDAEFTGTESLGEAIGLLTRGWPEGTARILKGLGELDGTDGQPAAEYDVYGAFPDVGAYLAGQPDHMVNLIPSGRIKPVRRLLVNGVYSHHVSTQEAENFGVGLLSLIQSLEHEGEAVELDWVWPAAGRDYNRDGKGRDNGFRSLLTVQLKCPGDPMDIDRLAFALAHPSMLRRCAFALVEQDNRFSRMGDRYGVSEDIPKGEFPDGLILPRLDSIRNAVETPRSALDYLTRYYQRHA